MLSLVISVSQVIARHICVLGYINISVSVRLSLVISVSGSADRQWSLPPGQEDPVGLSPWREDGRGVWQTVALSLLRQLRSAQTHTHTLIHPPVCVYVCACVYSMCVE